LVNAVYFKDQWLNAFNPAEVRDEPFKTGTQGVKAKLMHAKIHGLNYLDGNGFQLLELPYKGRDIAMEILLPKNAHGIPGLELALTFDNLQKAGAAKTSRKGRRDAAEIQTRRTVLACRYAARDGHDFGLRSQNREFFGDLRA